MILPLADALQNCLQNLTSRIAGVDNEQMTGRVMGMGAMLGFGIGAIKEQFNTPTNKLGNSNADNSAGGLKGFVNRAKSIISPSINLSAEKDYSGNINPIRDVVPQQKNIAIPTSNVSNKENISNGNQNHNKSIVGKVAQTGLNATKTYLSIGAKMAEGDFSKSPYKSNNQNVRKNNFQNTEYINNMAIQNNTLEKIGDENELNGKS